MTQLGRAGGPLSFILELAQFQLMADKNVKEEKRRDTLEALFNRNGEPLFENLLLERGVSTVDGARLAVSKERMGWVWSNTFIKERKSPFIIIDQSLKRNSAGFEISQTEKAFWVKSDLGNVKLCSKGMFVLITFLYHVRRHSSRHFYSLRKKRLPLISELERISWGRAKKESSTKIENSEEGWMYEYVCTTEKKRPIL